MREEDKKSWVVVVRSLVPYGDLGFLFQPMEDQQGFPHQGVMALASWEGKWQEG